MAEVDKLSPDDPRVQNKTAKVNGRTYGYILGEPEGTKRGTIFLIHGFPDLGFGWRYQIPMFMKLGLRVVAPDMMGYGRTDAPPYTIDAYSYKQCAEDMKELARQLGETRIILGGHDWGGAVVYRIALYQPDLISHVISICTPYFPQSPTYTPLPLITASHMKNLIYQNQFASGLCEENIPPTREGVSQFLRSLHGAKTSDGKQTFTPFVGIDFPRLPHLGPSPFLSEDETKYYLDSYTSKPPSSCSSHHPLHGPLNWYRTREQNYLDDLSLIDTSTKKPKQIHCPVLFIPAEKDIVFTKEMCEKTMELIGDCTMIWVKTGHWALWQGAREVNEIVGQWIGDVVFGGRSKL